MEDDKRLDSIIESSKLLVITHEVHELWRQCEIATGSCYMHGRTDLGDKLRLVQHDIVDVIRVLKKDLDEKTASFPEH